MPNHRVSPPTPSSQSSHDAELAYLSHIGTLGRGMACKAKRGGSEGYGSTNRRLSVHLTLDLYSSLAGPRVLRDEKRCTFPNFNERRAALHAHSSVRRADMH